MASIFSRYRELAQRVIQARINAASAAQEAEESRKQELIAWDQNTEALKRLTDLLHEWHNKETQ